MSASTFDVVDFISKVGLALITGVVAAIMTARYALNRFYQEKWWEKKHASYNQLIDKLFEIKAIYDHASNFYAAEYNAARDGTPEPKGEVDWVKYRQIMAMLHRYYVLAPISLSHTTKELLNAFFKQDAETDRSVYEENYPNFVAYNDMALAIKNLIDAIVLDAEKELKFK